MENLTTSINIDNIKIALEKQNDPIKQAITLALRSNCTIKMSFEGEDWTGSGFHIGNGYIATVAHVAPHKLINKNYDLTVTFDGAKNFKAKILVSNHNDDTAILYCQDAVRQPTAILGNSDELEVGDIIAVVGSPEGWHDTATVGRVSNKKQNLGEHAPSPAWNDMIFIDADILQGSSGAEVIATDGKVYGLVMGVTGLNAKVGIGENAVCPINKFKQLLTFYLHQQ